MTLEREHRLASLFARTHAGIKPGLGLMEELLEALGHPQRQFLSIHVAGTNGKGSCCAMLDCAVRELGFKAGLFTSPHLIKVNERIRLNGADISDEEFYDVLDQVQAVENSLSRLPTFFETLTAMSFLAFAQAGVQVAVIEVGMGGRLDCTNVVEPLLSVITRVDFDHTGYLGDTLTKIAGEKAGIIKHGRPVVIGPQDPEAEAVLIHRAAGMESPFRKAADVISISGRSQTLEGQQLNLSTASTDIGRVRFPLLGKFQLENLCTAVASMELFQELMGMEPDPEWIRRSLANVRWVGRGQLLQSQPPLLLDVAHNPGGAKALFELIQEIFGKKAKGVLFWAGLADKDSIGFLRTMRPCLSSCVCMDLQSERACSAETLCEFAEKEGLTVEVLSIAEAKAGVSERIGTAAFGCVAGSVYLGGEWLSGCSPDKGELLNKQED